MKASFFSIDFKYLKWYVTKLRYSATTSAVDLCSVNFVSQKKMKKKGKKESTIQKG